MTNLLSRRHRHFIAATATSTAAPGLLHGQIIGQPVSKDARLPEPALQMELRGAAEGRHCRAKWAGGS